MDILLQAFVLGAVGGLVPGAVMTLLFVSAMQGGLPAATRAFLWSMVSEICIAGGLLFIATLLPLDQKFFAGVGALGGVALLYFAYHVFQLRRMHIDGETTLFSAPKIFLISATNAPLYIFWSTICFPLIWQLAARWSLPIAALSYFTAFEIAWGITTYATVLAFVYSRSFLMNERIMHKVFIGIALVFVAFSIRLFLSAVALFL